MNGRQAFDHCLSRFAAALIPDGFTRDRAVLRLTNENDDCLIVEPQKADISDEHEVEFYVNIGFVLAPRWQWDKQRYGKPASSLPRHFNGTYRRRLAQHLLGGSHRWQVFNQQSADEVSLELIRLFRDEFTWLKRLLDREELLRLALDGQTLGFASWQTTAWLIAGLEGHSQRLDQLLAERPQEHNAPVRAAILAYAEQAQRAP